MDRVRALRRPVVGTVGERLTALQREGYRATPQRRAILETMISAGRENVTAEELCRRARAVCPTVNLATTYRTLDLLGRLGMVRRLTYGDGRSVFCPNVHPHYHGTCLRCGAVVDIPRRRVAKALEQEQAKLTDGAFIVVGHRIEFYGYCADCRSAAPTVQS
jgi:Fur family transcriptional regulator, peroxide stress response regulator